MKNIAIMLLLISICCCNGKTKTVANKASAKDNSTATGQRQPNKAANGIIYFSKNNGKTWENTSNGLPDTIGLGLGAIAVSGNLLVIATKNKGIYYFDAQQNIWVQIPTDSQIMDSNLGALAIYKNRILVGTQVSGVFSTADRGLSWTNPNAGLGNLTIRKLAVIGHKLFAATNAGLYSYEESNGKWKLEYGTRTLQVNGITKLNEQIFIGTNQGIFTSQQSESNWINVLDHRSIHNISSDDRTLYAMTYNELLASTDNGKTWKNIQKGLPAQLYTFNVMKNGDTVFAGQWDGVYRIDNSFETWKPSSSGLPENFAITNMQSYHGIIVVSGNERKLHPGMTTAK